MKKPLLFVLLGLLVILVVGAAAWWQFTPRLLEVSPVPGSGQASVWAPIRVTFTRPLAPGSAAAHLVIRPEQPGEITWQVNTLVFTPSQPWPSGAEIRVEFKAGAQAAGLLSLPLRAGLSWRFNVEPVRLAYLWPPDAPADLYALDPQNGDIRRLTQGAAILDYSLSADGKTIYLSADSGARLARLDLTMGVPAEGQTLPLETVLECPDAVCRLVQPSPDGARLAFERLPLLAADEADHTKVWLYTLATGENQLAGEDNRNTSYPAWSSTGWLAYYDKQAQAFILYQPETGERSALPNQTGEPGVWQPDGAAFVAPEVFIEETGLLDASGASRLIRFELEQGLLAAQIDLTQRVDAEDTSPVFSPDGSQMAFARRYLDPVRWTPGRQVWLMDAGGSEPVALTNEPAFNHYNLVWKPDGSQIAYVRSDPTHLNQPPELWLHNIVDGSRIQLVIGGYAPAWIP
jgi:Tol biopolymer transport system component